MKHFIYTITSDKHDRNRGTHDRTATVYQIKRNLPELVGTVSWNTGSCMDRDGLHEVGSILAEKKRILKSWLKENRYVILPDPKYVITRI